MKLALVVQYNYNGTISIAEPIGAKDFDYYEIATAKTLQEAKEKAYNYYKDTDYELIFVDEIGDEM